VLRNAFWLALIAGALAAIAGGFAQGTFSAHPPALVELRKASRDRRNAVSRGASWRREEARVTDRGQFQSDAFSRDDVVVERPRAAGALWEPERLALVVGVCGDAFAAQSRWLRLGFPLAFIVAPDAPQAARFAALVHSAGDPLFLQLASAPGPARLAQLRARFTGLAGVASRETAGMAAALRGSGLAFLDERGNAAGAAAFARAGVVLIRRDVTGDDVAEFGYVTFMLGRAAELSRREGTIVVLLRPQPVTLAALRTFSHTHGVQMVPLR
jgi:polysaccharide deacetylase 2 family uncharacterized protein YibQ